MKVVGTHTIQFGGSYHYDQIDERNFDDPNGTFGFSDANETGAAFADFLMGADSGNFTQSSPQILDNRGIYVGLFVSDTWRARPSLTLNYGLRYEIITPWWDTANKMETIIPGEQSKVFIELHRVGISGRCRSAKDPRAYQIRQICAASWVCLCSALVSHSNFMSKVLGGARHVQHSWRLRHLLHQFPGRVRLRRSGRCPVTVTIIRRPSRQ